MRKVTIEIFSLESRKRLTKGYEIMDSIDNVNNGMFDFIFHYVRA